GAHDDLVHHGPPGALEIQAVRVVRGRPTALFRLPGGFHGPGVVEPEFYDGVPRGLAAVVGQGEILDVAPQTRHRQRERPVDVLEIAAELVVRPIRTPIAYDHELEHRQAREAPRAPGLAGAL